MRTIFNNIGIAMRMLLWLSYIALLIILPSCGEDPIADEPNYVRFNVSYAGKEFEVKGWKEMELPQEGGAVIITPDDRSGNPLREFDIFYCYGEEIPNYDMTVSDIPDELYESGWGTLKVTWDRNGSWETRVRQVTKIVLTLSPNMEEVDREVYIGAEHYPILIGGLKLTQPGLGD